MRFAPQDFIQLPPLGEARTLTLVDELEAAHLVARPASASAQGALARLLESTSTLRRWMVARERSGSAADPKARAADRALDDAWGAFQSWLLGWTRLPERAHARVPDARRLYASLFPKGLQFLTLDFKDEWTESQNRLDHIATRGLDLLIDELGGGPFLHTIARAHRAYGDALHITGAGTTPEPDAMVRRALEETHMALRDYVAQVAAMVRRDDPGLVGAAASLLAPLTALSREAAYPADDETLASAVPFGAG
ncbi:MAG: hypothetical protein KIS78_13645, partial [Labilithrix sp.]|nr:hypothetical protein [Labilithrix sp.]